MDAEHQICSTKKIEWLDISLLDTLYGIISVVIADGDTGKKTQIGKTYNMGQEKGKQNQKVL